MLKMADSNPPVDNTQEVADTEQASVEQSVNNIVHTEDVSTPNEQNVILQELKRITSTFGQFQKQAAEDIGQFWPV